MANLQEVFNRIKEAKKEQRDIKLIYKDALENSVAYKNVVEEYEKLRAKKKQIENDTKSEFKSELAKLDGLKEEIKSDNELLSDLALNQLMKGETVVVKDENEEEFEPVFVVRFRRPQ